MGYQDGAYRRPKGEASIDREIGKIQDSEGEINTEGHERIDQALRDGAHKRIERHPRYLLDISRYDAVSRVVN